MNITKEQADKVIDALSMNRIMARDENGNYTKEITAQVVVEALSIMRGLAEDAEPVGEVLHRMKYHSEDPSDDLDWELFPMDCTECETCIDVLIVRASPQAAQTAVKSESLAQAAQALAQPPSEGKPIEALAPVEIKPGVLYELKPGGVHVFKAQTEAALSEVVRLSEDAGLYGADFQTEAQEREAFDAWFDSTPHGEPSYQETFSAGYQAGRAGRKV